MNIRPMRVSSIFDFPQVPLGLVVVKVEDLPGMQACNLQNLPENYTMRYCQSPFHIEMTDPDQCLA